MTKADLRSGQRVTLRDGDQCMVMLSTDKPGRELIDFKFGFMGLDRYNTDLTTISGRRKWDIVKVESAGRDIVKLFSDPDSIRWKTIWQRSEKTYLQDFLSKYPNAPLKEDGAPDICLRKLYGDVVDCEIYCNCVPCWNTKMEDKND